MPNVFWTADSHYGHRNMLKYYPKRGSTVEDMDEMLIRNWNSVVKPGDTVYHCGDFAWSYKDTELEKLVRRLNGQIHLILGNHDHKGYKSYRGFAWVGQPYQGKMVKIGDQSVYCAHYAHTTWAQSHRGTWHVFGHSHGNLQDGAEAGKLRCDVGVDAWDYYPVSMEQLRAVMERKKFEAVDHHR